ncbi:glycosyltransferase family 4 protein [Roseomonas marmotae]|uniref:Glycosyltransferase family 4 protein n=1 Tax=Roseomonas marmotae TaxID=2768161 RepID=A0ABS3K9R9_9PROT|nr:glycosyltransferase family 4 protein [Roseomonas marmotae]MBO1074201.1 glycosyltransferase family 4 protein [Roseomonas marmotae]QTI78971.1 glycosyltransferase family 4 protein [Roseomonas marmotae]
MRIAQIAPLTEAVPPKLYGGTERIVSYLTESLVELGHEVTLFASGDSVTAATLAPMSAKALRLDPSVRDTNAPLTMMLETVYRRRHEFDVLHFHLDYLPFSLFSRQSTPFLTTMHGRLDLPELQPVFDAFRDIPVVSISNDQRKPLPQANFARTIYHGLPEKLLTPRTDTAPGYLAFLGRIAPEKRCDRAIEIAIATNTPIKIAAKVDRVDVNYYEQKIRPMMDHPLVEFIGEINEQQKPAFLSGAKALLTPIDWPEPFGLVMIEAMACGTPVIAFRHGSVPEVVDEGVTGFAVQSMEDAIGAVGRLDSLPRAAVRARFEQRFTARRMAEDYVALYEELAQSRVAEMMVAAE